MQLLIYSLANPEAELTPGTLLWITAVIKLDDDARSQPTRFELSLTRRHQTFAPFEADLALQESAYDLPVVVTK